MKVTTMHERHSCTIPDYEIQEPNVARSSFISHAGDAIRTTPVGPTTSDDRINVVPVSTEDMAFVRSGSEKPNRK